MDTDALIAAIASPGGVAPRGIIRLSGDGAIALLGAMDAGMSGGAAERIQSRGVHLVRIRLNRHAELPALALVYPGPRSYTGQDVVELLLPGNPVLLQRVVDALIETGRKHSLDIRPAEPGEFTARAYFNGRLSLTEAEGVAAVIAARTDAELRAAKLLTEGKLGATARDLADRLASALALVEAGIDFTDEEDVVAISPHDLYERLVSLHQFIDDHLQRNVGAESLRFAPHVVLAGPPNAGKSTLFNALLGRDRAVVSDVAGTTRDVLIEPLTIDTDHGPSEVMLVDLAGLDEPVAHPEPEKPVTATADPADMGGFTERGLSGQEILLNRHMQRSAREVIDRADLILLCRPLDGDDSATEPEFLVSSSDHVVAVRTKADRVSHARQSDEHTMIVSAVTGDGLDELRHVIADRLADRAVCLAGDAVALQGRHESSLESARNHLAEAISLVEPQRKSRTLADSELIASSMRSGLDALTSLAGDITPDDVLGRIFATFCVGK